MHRYGIGAGDFDEIVNEQGGVCPLCGREDPEHVDHDHATGTVRGVLCFNCNGGLGQFRDSIDCARERSLVPRVRVDPDMLELDGARARTGEGIAGIARIGSPA